MNNNTMVLLQSGINSVLEKHWNSFYGDKGKVLDYDKEFNNPWFGALDEWIKDLLQLKNNSLSGFPDFKLLFDAVNYKSKENIGFFPKGTSHVTDISKQLDILLPQENIIKEVLPVLLTCYIYKYRNDMKDSTMQLVSLLINEGNKKEVVIQIDRKLSCFTLSPIFTRLSKMTYKDIRITNYAILRRYHLSLIFAHLLLRCKDICNVSLSLRLFAEMGEDMKIFLSPIEYKQAGLSSYDYSKFEKDYYKNEIIEIMEKRAEQDNIEFDYITLRFKRLLCDKDNTTEEDFYNSLTPGEQIFNIIYDNL